MQKKRTQNCVRPAPGRKNERLKKVTDKQNPKNRCHSSGFVVTKQHVRKPAAQPAVAIAGLRPAKMPGKTSELL